MTVLPIAGKQGGKAENFDASSRIYLDVYAIIKGANYGYVDSN